MSCLNVPDAEPHAVSKKAVLLRGRYELGRPSCNQFGKCQKYALQLFTFRPSHSFLFGDRDLGHIVFPGAQHPCFLF